LVAKIKQKLMAN